MRHALPPLMVFVLACGDGTDSTPDGHSFGWRG
jgi:hypothetical protein